MFSVSAALKGVFLNHNFRSCSTKSVVPGFQRIKHAWLNGNYSVVKCGIVTCGCNLWSVANLSLKDVSCPHPGMDTPGCGSVKKSAAKVMEKWASGKGLVK